MTRTVVYATPDLNFPVGGIRTVYRHVELLAEAGYRALVWHAAREAPLDWFDNEASVVCGESLDLTDDDLVVIPEGLVFDGVDPAPGCRKVIHNQNHFYTFGSASLSGYPRWDPPPAVWASSETIHDVLSRLAPTLHLSSVEVVPYAIDTHLFRPAAMRERKVTWMPRKRPNEAALIRALLAADPSFDDVVCKPLEGLSEEQTAAELGSTSVFIALGREEGFGLPVAEALAAGCAVVGYPSGGGAELFDAPGTHAVADSDVVAIVDRVRELLDDEPSKDIRLKYREWVEEHHSAAGLRRRLEAAVSRAFALPATAGTCRHPWTMYQQRRQATPSG